MVWPPPRPLATFDAMIRPADHTLAPDPVRDAVLALLRTHRARFAERYGVRDLVLFGSVARGEATDTSDVDLVVEFDPECVTLTSFLDFAEDLEALLGRRVDIVSLPKLPPRLRARVEAEALRVA
jgi:predicted nucleotidyltransferase